MYLFSTVFIRSISGFFTNTPFRVAISEGLTVSPILELYFEKKELFTSCPSVEFFVIPPLIKSLSILCSSLIPYSYLIKLNHLWSEFISSTVRFVQLRNYIYFLKYFESNKKKKKDGNDYEKVNRNKFPSFYR